MLDKVGRSEQAEESRVGASSNLFEYSREGDELLDRLYWERVSSSLDERRAELLERLGDQLGVRNLVVANLAKQRARPARGPSI